MAYERKSEEKVEQPPNVEPKMSRRKRIWQSPKGPNCKVTLVTLHRIDLTSGRMIAYAEIKPNQVGQYVLLPNAVEHSSQVEAMESYCEKYGLYPVDLRMEGVMPTSYEGMVVPENTVEAVTSLQSELERVKRANAELMKKIADTETVTA